MLAFTLRTILLSEDRVSMLAFTLRIFLFEDGVSMLAFTLRTILLSEDVVSMLAFTLRTILLSEDVVSMLAFTLRTILLSEDGVLPIQRANLQGSPSTCSVTPNSEVCASTAKQTQQNMLFTERL